MGWWCCRGYFLQKSGKKRELEKRGLKESLHGRVSVNETSQTQTHTFRYGILFPFLLIRHCYKGTASFPSCFLSNCFLPSSATSMNDQKRSLTVSSRCQMKIRPTGHSKIYQYISHLQFQKALRENGLLAPRLG